MRSEDRTEELACYGRWLAIASRVALVALVAAFAAYLAGWIPAVIPVEATPRLWGRAASEVLLERFGGDEMRWSFLLKRADGWNLLGIAVLSSCTIPPLAALMRVYRRQGARALALLCAAQAAIILLAAALAFLAHA